MGPGFALLTVGAITGTAALVRGELPSSRVFAGAAIAGGVLVAVGQASPDVASRFATVVLITALLTSGVELATAAGRLTGISTSSPTPRTEGPRTK